MKKQLILHGHFYQPPRENPETGIIPIQRSAYPKDNWNIRIADECYSANAFSRYLTYDGRIRSIVNNYEYLSFNFGPTLLHWLREERSDVYRRIIEADRRSLERLGHGNAIAQSFNHTILPLDTRTDAEIEIDWGLEDFSFHFSRQAEGMWLPEAAVNERVIDMLIERSITFIILSPWQAAAVETEPGKWTDLSGDPAPYARPYRIERPHGSLSVFFYHPGLAEGISFGHFLQDADALYERIQSIFTEDASQLLHTATDGEIYGHHEPFGDMCLAALIKRSEAENHFSFTNYASYLDQNSSSLQPLRATLKKGESGKGTSWSCFHGVSRWYKDCGCSTGGESGWNQKWRTPLRKAFTAVSRKLVTLFSRELGKISSLSAGTEPMEVLNKYGAVLSGRVSPETFVEQLLGDNHPEEEAVRLLSLLEGQKFRLFMFTSCGWFFSDISGIEPRQNIAYAVQAVKMNEPYLESDLYSELSAQLQKAESNIPEAGSGADILREITEKSLPCGLESAIYFTLNRILAEQDEWEHRYGSCMLVDIRKNSAHEYEISLKHAAVMSKLKYIVKTEMTHDKGLLLHAEMEELVSESCGVISMQELNSYLVSRLFRWIDQSLERVTDNDLERITENMKYYTGISRNSSYQPDDHFYIVNMGTCMRTLNTLFRYGIPYYDRTKFQLIQSLLEFIFSKGGDEEREAVHKVLSAYMNQIEQKIRQSCTSGLIAYTKDLLMLIRNSGLVPDIAQLQNTIYALLQESAEGRESDKHDYHADNELGMGRSGKCPEKELRELAEQAGIAVQE